MKVPSEFICKVCKRVFCCAKCRYKHEIKTHAIVVQKPRKIQQSADLVEFKCGEQSNESGSKIYILCPLCEQNPMPLQSDIHAEMLAHIEQYHLPLQCRKCTKTYSRIDDLRDFSNCTHTSVPICGYPEQSCDTVAIQKDLSKVTISTQTSPLHSQIGHFNETPISLMNVRWKAKSKVAHEEYVSDSASSLKNMSSISNGSMRRSLDAIIKPKSQLVRTTSTPVHAELLCAKHTEGAFNGSGGQVSSIYHSSGESDHNNPAINAPTATAANAGESSPSKQQLESINRYLKVSSVRGKMSAVTPLRQVMSKSIQKAFAEHGGLPSAQVTGAVCPRIRKQMYDSQSVDNCSPVGSPLDLRLSPVIRRTQSEINTISTNRVGTSNASTEQKSAKTQKLRHKMLRSSQNLTTTESIVITRTKHLSSMESAASSTRNNGIMPIETQAIDHSLSLSATSNSSGVSTVSSGSIYKTCHSVEIITATTALSKIQQGYYAVSNDDLGSAIRKITPVMQPVERVVSSNLAPITPITRIPGAVINKKQIQFDSPYEIEEEEEMKRKMDHALMTNFTKIATPISSENTTAYYTLPTQINAPQVTPEVAAKTFADQHQADFSAAETFFTPDATPVRKSKKRTAMECAATRHTPFLRECGKSLAFNKTQNFIFNDNENDEVFLPEAVTQKTEPVRNSMSTVGRSWSFGAFLGSMMRLPSISKGAVQKKSETLKYEEDHPTSLIKRCASIAGSLVRSRSLMDEDPLHNQKRKRSNMTGAKSVCSGHYQRSYSDPISPSSENSTGTKRFRIQGRKPIERMRRDT